MKLTNVDDLICGRIEAPEAPTCQFGMNESQPELSNAYGGLPQQTAWSLSHNQIRPMTQYLGFGPQAGTPAAARFQDRLAGGVGPLAEYLRQFTQFAPGVYGQAQGIGNQVADRGQGAYDQFNQQLQAALGSMGQYGQSADRANALAGRYAERAANPLADEDLYQVAQRRVMSQLRGSLASRGLEGATGAGAQAESDTLRGLATDFAGQRRADQYNSLSALEQAGQSGAGIAGARTQLGGAGLDAVSQLSQLLQSRYGIPMQAFGQMLNLLTAGQQPGLALTQATAPQLGQSSSGWRLI